MTQSSVLITQTSPTPVLAPQRSQLRHFLILCAMLLAAGAAILLKPTQRVADQGPKVDLETMIPRTFGDWREEKQTSAQIVDPQQKELIDKIYSQTLSRTYVNANGNQW